MGSLSEGDPTVWGSIAGVPYSRAPPNTWVTKVPEPPPACQVQHLRGYLSPQRLLLGVYLGFGIAPRGGGGGCGVNVHNIP